MEVISPPSEGLSPPFLSLFVLIFDAGGDGGGIGDNFRMYLVRRPLKIQGYGSDEKIIESEIFGMAQK